jgi:hypothetical protein
LSERLNNVTRVAVADVHALAGGLARYRDPSHGRSRHQDARLSALADEQKGNSIGPVWRKLHSIEGQKTRRKEALR